MDREAYDYDLTDERLQDIDIVFDRREENPARLVAALAPPGRSRSVPGIERERHGMIADWQTISGTKLHDEAIPARAGWSRELKQGEVLRLVDLEGKQAVDFLCYNARDHEDRYAAADTMKINGNIFIGKGTVLYSVNCNPLLTVVEDTLGFHDTIGGCCSDAVNIKRYNNAGHGSCRANFLAEFKKWGLTQKDYAANVNFFAYVPIGPKGEMDFRDPLSEPGDHVDLRADMDVIAIISNCPQINNPAAGFNPSPLQAVIWDPEG